MNDNLDIDAARRVAFEAVRQHRAEQEQAQPNGRYYKDEGTPKPPEITPIDFAGLPDREPPPRRFVIGGWMPDGCLSSLYGPGGVGKSLLAQQAATCIATGLDFLGAPVDRRPVLGLFSEDDDDELIRRQWRLNQALGLINGDLVDLHIQGRAGLDNTIASFAAAGAVRENLYSATVAKAKAIGASLVILDNRAQMLLVNENDRAAATFAANLCAGIAREVNGAVLLLGHVAKADGSEYSGSTAWDAVTRSRWWLYRPKTEDKDASPELILERVKSNYAGQDTMRLAWADGALRPVDEAHMTYTDRLAAEQRQGAARQAFLDQLDQFTAQGRAVSHSAQARNYAPRFMRANGGSDEFTVRELERAMNDLFAQGRILAGGVIGKRANRSELVGIVRAGAH
jgi:RecA-family ATPase